MHKVRCINDDWENLSDSHVVRKVLLVGDELPIKGKEYLVKAIAMVNGKMHYELEGLDYSAYGAIGVFNVARFENVERKFVPNHICEATGELAFKQTCYVDMRDIPLPNHLKYLTIEFIMDEDTFGVDKSV